LSLSVPPWPPPTLHRVLSTHISSNATMMLCLPSLWILSGPTSPRDRAHKAGVGLLSLYSAFINQCLWRSPLKGSCKVFAPPATTFGARERNDTIGHS